MGANINNRGEKGGNNYKTLNINEMPAHNHTCTMYSAGSHIHVVQVKNAGDHRHTLIKYKLNHGKDGRGTTEAMWSDGDVYADSVPIQSANASGGHEHVVSIDTSGDHTHVFGIGNKGGTKRFDNSPQFYALAYIMKL